MGKDILEREFLKLDSWYIVLKIIDDFFDDGLYENNEEIKNQEMIKNYYASEKIFTLFYQDYGCILENISNTSYEKKIENEKLKILGKETFIEKKQSEKNIITKKNQPVKEITYQDVFYLGEELKKLSSWQKTLKGVVTFFSEVENSLKEETKVNQFRLHTKQFLMFYQQFLETMQSMEKKIEKIKRMEKVKK